MIVKLRRIFAKLRVKLYSSHSSLRPGNCVWATGSVVLTLGGGAAGASLLMGIE